MSRHQTSAATSKQAGHRQPAWTSGQAAEDNTASENGHVTLTPLITVDPDFEQEYPGANALATECYANLVRTGDMLIGLHNREAAEEYRLSATGRMALAIIEGAGEPLEPGVIAERLIITSGSMTSMLDTLEKRGLIRRMPHPTDRRKLLVDITDEARAILDSILPSLHLREHDVITAALTPAEQRSLLPMLAKLQLAAQAEAANPRSRKGKRIKRVESARVSLANQ